MVFASEACSKVAGQIIAFEPICLGSMYIAMCDQHPGTNPADVMCHASTGSAPHRPTVPYSHAAVESNDSNAAKVLTAALEARVGRTADFCETADFPAACAFMFFIRFFIILTVVCAFLCLCLGSVVDTVLEETAHADRLNLSQDQDYEIR